MTNLSTKVSLFLRAIDLPNKDTMSKNDCFAVVYIKAKPQNDNSDGAFQEVYRTQTVKDNNSPQWPEACVVDYRFEEVQELKFEVWDRDSKSESLKNHDFLGSVETTMSKIMGARGATFSGLLNNKKGKETRGRFVVIGQEVSQNKDEIEIQFSADKLERKNMMGLGRSDPFYVISQEQPDGKFIRVFESEILKSTTKPVWKQQRFSVQLLCNGKPDIGLKIDVFDWESDGGHNFIGTVTTSVSQLRDTNVLNLTNPTSKKKSTGEFYVSNFKYITKAGFLEYVRGGCEVKLSIAIDFTGSNGPAYEENSLHYIPPNFFFTGDRTQVSKLNEYQKAILSIGQIVQDYDTDQMIPVYGFGASLPNGSGMDMHCFPLTMDPKHPECHRVQGIMETYNKAISTLGLSGPTFFKGILRKAINDAQPVSQANQSYNILLIITDGQINDMTETVDLIIEASTKNLSVIIVGVGRADFSGMEFLDSDGAKLQQYGKTSKRDVVQFVPFSKFFGKSFTMLAEETLREIPPQLEEYFRLAEVKPNKPTDADPGHFAGIPTAEIVHVLP